MKHAVPACVHVQVPVLRPLFPNYLLLNAGDALSLSRERLMYWKVAHGASIK